ncbi:MAG TPA: hypothetical protein G4N98_00590 [Thermoflexia bacterium]|nr:hypothetical protein [Thermoflexia bacterium]
MEREESLGKRLKRFGALVSILFIITVAVIVTQRLSNDALALLIGLAVGIIAMLPLVGLLAFIWRRQELHYQEARQYRPAERNLPVVVIAPSALPGYGPQRAEPGAHNRQAGSWEMARAERKFTIVGGEQ